MKILIIFASVVCVVFGRQIRAGGLHDADPSTYPTYLKMALGELGLALDQNVEVVGVQTQVFLCFNTLYM